MERWPRRRGRANRYVAVSRLVGAALLVGLIILATVGVDLYTDWLWFDSVRFSTVYLTTLGSQVALFFGGAVIFWAGYFPSAFLARRLAYRFEPSAPPEEDGIWAYIARVGSRVGEQNAYRRVVNAGIVILGLFLGVIMGMVAAGQWPLFMRYQYQVPFNLIDPVFGQDVGFYVFSLPFLRAVHSWLLGAMILIATTTLAVYAVVTAYELGVNLERVMFSLPSVVLLHLAGLAALLMLLVAANHLLDLYELAYSTRGVAFGPGYTDVRAEMPALYIMFGTAIVAAALIALSAVSRSLRPAITGLGLWGLVAIFGGLIFPNVVEAFEVKPNQLERERPYIENSIAFTRKAYGLDAIQEQFYPADDAVTVQDIRANPETVRNIRLWDHRPLRDAYNQLQSIRSYYTFDDVDVDRYQVNNGYRQVMVAARELAPENLQAQARTWVNQRLKFTHGYGVAMAPVAAVAEEGRPQLLIQDVPPRGDIPITRPEIYYGTRQSGYVIVKTTEAEFDYPRGDENVETRHEGNTGVNLGNLARRAAYALRFRDGNILLSGALRPDSEILYRRAIRERVDRIAPFLMQDSDPYIVVADGQLFWMLDAYTVSNAFPYSQPLAHRRAGVVLNYIRNSVKVVMSAYDGSLRFYVADPEDPVIRTYQRIFPDLFLPISEMPTSLRQHVRYPEDLFRIQADRYQTFHMQDPTVFYNREDVWAIPNEKFYDRSQPVDPYYVIMRLPGQAREEFLLMQPFSPLGKDNMIAWLAAPSDEPNYGKLLVYKYPKEKLVYGPFQVEGRIDQDPQISSQFTLWSQAGSRVIRGNLLVIPVGTSNIYVEPIYLQAENGPIPELKRVIVSTGNRLVMEPTLDEAMAKLFGAGVALPTAAPAAAPAPAPAGSAAMSPEVFSLIQSASANFTRAQEALRAADWARYGEAQRALEADLKRLSELTGQ
jgi:uncharacterized membrane protein (UPF0182 family)